MIVAHCTQAFDSFASQSLDLPISCLLKTVRLPVSQRRYDRGGNDTLLLPWLMRFAHRATSLPDTTAISHRPGGPENSMLRWPHQL